MRYFNYLNREDEKAIFHSAPAPFNKRDAKEVLAHAIGAVLYMPATRPTIADDILSGKFEGLVSIVMDLEDAVGDHQVQLAEESLVQHVYRLAALLQMGALQEDELPLLFIRVRTPEQCARIIGQLQGAIECITGFVFPKFTAENGKAFFELLDRYHETKRAGAPLLYGMPVLETAGIIYREQRLDTLLAIKSILDGYRDYVLNVRVGATDFSSLFGIRRSAELTIYDIAVIRDCISDIMNVFGRMGDEYVISGPVWEYFQSDRVLKAQVRRNPYDDHAGRGSRGFRNSPFNRYLEGLLREVALDKENGMLGKTIIHPTHIKPVLSLYAVTHEEFADATAIIDNNNGFLGVMKSPYSNKMNEIKPHLNWAHKMIIRSKIYGVLHEHQSFASLLLEQEYDHEQASL